MFLAPPLASAVRSSEVLEPLLARCKVVPLIFGQKFNSNSFLLLLVRHLLLVVTRSYIRVFSTNPSQSCVRGDPGIRRILDKYFMEVNGSTLSKHEMATVAFFHSFSRTCLDPFASRLHVEPPKQEFVHLPTTSNY